MTPPGRQGQGLPGQVRLRSTSARAKEQQGEQADVCAGKDDDKRAQRTRGDALLLGPSPRRLLGLCGSLERTLLERTALALRLPLALADTVLVRKRVILVRKIYIGVWGRGAQTGNSLKRGVCVCERVACVARGG